MLIVRPIGPDAAAYYRHDRTGRWWGAGVAALGLEGTPQPGELHAVLAARSPRDGAALHRTRVDRRAGWDLVFAAPKSLSLLAAGAPQEGPGSAAAAVVAAHVAAVDDALSWIEEHACWARRSVGVVAAEGMVAARFTHRTSAAGDPHLHDHVLMANLARAAGAWSSLDHGGLWLQRRAVAAAYHLGLRHHLLARGLDFEWAIGSTGAADVVGVPRAALDAASRRREQVLEHRRQHGRSDGRAHDRVLTRAGATLALPSHPDAGPPSRWHPDAACRAAAQRADERRVGSERARDPDEVVGAVLRHLLAERSRYQPTDVMAALARTHPDGARADDAHRWAVGLCAASLHCPDGRFTSPLAADADRALATRMAGGAGRGLGQVAPDAVAEVLAGRPELGPASGASLRSLLGNGHGVAVVDGTWAGAGPGREPWVGQAALLDAAVTAWHDAGHRVALDATSDAARRRWSALCGVTDHPGGTSPTVLIVDRADRRPTPELHRLLDRAAAQATKVILVVGAPCRLVGGP